MCVTYILLLSYTITLVSASQECGWNYCDEFSYCDSQYKECLPCSGICYDGTKYEMLCKTQCPDYQIAHETTSSIDQVSRGRIESSTLEPDSTTIATEQSDYLNIVKEIVVPIMMLIMFITVVTLLCFCKGQKHGSNMIKQDPETPDDLSKDPLMELEKQKKGTSVPGGIKPRDLPKAKDEVNQKLDTTRPPVTNIPPSDLTSSR